MLFKKTNKKIIFLTHMFSIYAFSIQEGSMTKQHLMWIWFDRVEI